MSGCRPFGTAEAWQEEKMGLEVARDVSWGEAVAAYAAVVATAGLVWNVFVWTREHRLRVHVTGQVGGPSQWVGHSDIVLAKVVNRSRRPVEVVEIGVAGRPLVPSGEHSGRVPKLLARDESLTVVEDRTDPFTYNEGGIEHLERRRRRDEPLSRLGIPAFVRFYARLATGEKFESKRYEYVRSAERLE